MSRLLAFKLRPYKQGRDELRDVFKIHATQASLNQANLRHKDLCQLEGPDGNIIVGEVAETQRDIQQKVIQVTQAFKEIHGLKYEETYVLRKHDAPIEQVASIDVLEIYPEGENGLATDGAARINAHYWSGFITCLLAQTKYVSEGLLLEDLRGAQRRHFKVTNVKLSSGRSTLPGGIYKFLETSSILVHTADVKAEPSLLDDQVFSAELTVSNSNLAGIDAQLVRLNEEIARYYRGKFKSNAAVIIHGPPGTGKTSLLEETAKLPWKKVLDLERSTIGSQATIRDIEKTFAEAAILGPTLIVIDDLESFCDDQTIIKTLRKGLKSVVDKPVLVLAATHELRDIPSSLRKAYGFRKKIELQVPDAVSRSKILNVLFAQHTDVIVEGTTLERFSEIAHGYNCDDLKSVVCTAMERAEDRFYRGKPSSHTSSQHGITGVSEKEGKERFLEIQTKDLEAAFEEIRPSAMNEVFLETPRVLWTDVGGQQDVKDALTEAVSWPLKYPEKFLIYGLRPEKGMLLYGPPGCSKTLTAAAVAHEAGLNFLAVKGAEVLTMYVGESERKVRDIFSKARAAQPSILFLDEIDAVGAVREAGHSGVQVLTTLLNELDGIEPMKGVFVLAATNKPWVLDPALMRPGRLDRIMYVPLPDEATRKDIFHIRLGAMKHDDSINIDWLAQNTAGFSGAEITKMCQQAGYEALKETMKGQAASAEEEPVRQRHFQAALDASSRGVSEAMVKEYEEWSRAMKR